VCRRRRPPGQGTLSIICKTRYMRLLAPRLPPFKAYVALVIGLGVACCAVVFALDGSSLSRLWSPEVALFVACALAGELIPQKVVTRGVQGEVTTSGTFAIATMLDAGPACAIAALVGASIAADAMRRKAPVKLLFISCQYAITLSASGLALMLLTGVPRMDTAVHFAPGDLPGILAAAAVFFLVNSSLVATVIALVQGLRVGRYLVQDWFFQVSTGGLLLGLAPMVALAADFALPFVALLFLPLLAVHRGAVLFEPQLDRYSPRRLSLAGSLRSGIADGEIVLFYQPKAKLTTGRIIGVEALARWRHPRLGLIGPSEFVPIAEQTGLIGPLTSHVLEEALNQVREWSEQGEELSVAVNLSARSFLDAQLAVEIPRLLE
jgi:hypothetical protein